MKIIHLPQNVGNLTKELAEAERELGLKSQFLELSGHSNYNTPSSVRMKNFRGPIAGRISGLANILLKQHQLDALVFNYGSSIIHHPPWNMSLLELPVYRNSIRKIFIFQGCDVREKFGSIKSAYSANQASACTQIDCYSGSCNSGKKDKFRRKTALKAARYADVIFACNPDLIDFLPLEKTVFLPYPTSKRLDEFAKNRVSLSILSRLRIAHTPSDRATKGTKFIFHAIDQLPRAYKEKLELVVIEKQEHRAAMQLLSTCHLHIDQALTGWYGTAAVEAMQLGMPSMVYINPSFYKNCPSRLIEELPFIQFDLMNLKNKIMEIIDNRDLITQHAVASENFLSNWHDRLKIASLTRLAYSGASPSDISSFLANGYSE
jgi:hypothetical protein